MKKESIAAWLNVIKKEDIAEPKASKEIAIQEAIKCIKQNCELVKELRKTRIAIKNGVGFGYIYDCECTSNWLNRVEKTLEKVEGGMSHE